MTLEEFTESKIAELSPAAQLGARALLQQRREEQKAARPAKLQAAVDCHKKVAAKINSIADEQLSRGSFRSNGKLQPVEAGL